MNKINKIALLVVLIISATPTFAWTYLNNSEPYESTRQLQQQLRQQQQMQQQQELIQLEQERNQLMQQEMYQSQQRANSLYRPQGGYAQSYWRY